MKQLLLYLLFCCILYTAQAATFTVTDTTNGTTTDGISLRWAITQANTASSHDTITFDIPGMAPHSITLINDLPSINDNGLFVDGTSQPPNGYTGTAPKIIVTNIDTAQNGFYFFVPYTAKVKGLEISNFTEAGIYAFGSSVMFTVEDCKLTKNYDGVSIFGSVAHGDIHTSKLVENLDDGVLVYGASAYALIHDNLISGNGAYGIEIGGGSDSTTIQGNLIGTDSTGITPYPNGSDGIYLACHNGLVGGENPGEGNTIAFNPGDGIRVYIYDYNMISRNSIFCNGGLGINLYVNGNSNYASPVILNATTTGASGTATANSKIELFYDDSCSGCQGKTFIDAVMTDSLGSWTYSGPLQLGSSITATARDTGNYNTSRFSTCVLITTIGISEDVYSNSLKVYPNPAKDYLEIQMPSAKGLGEMAIFNNKGTQVYSQPAVVMTGQRISLKDFAAGLYFVRLMSADGFFLSKFAVVK
jgi:hypothetical protein